MRVYGIIGFACLGEWREVGLKYAQTTRTAPLTQWALDHSECHYKDKTPMDFHGFVALIGYSESYALGLHSFA
jgi:hypothetical protein